ncbi:hypothetical protein BSKO_11726 [Bryopsis sp. KO-2023]|nr:hypothetical protein BSKO_11726 [Bryopsis sp. KO-2023]
MHRFAVSAVFFLALTAGAHGKCTSVKNTVGKDSFLWKAIEATGLVGAVTSGGITLLAPTDAALTDAAMLVGLSVEELLGETAALTEILKYHVLTSTVKAADLAGDASFPTALTDASCGVSEVTGGEMIGGGLTSASVTAGDKEACKGTIVHEISAVLVACPLQFASATGGSSSGSSSGGSG